MGFKIILLLKYYYFIQRKKCKLTFCAIVFDAVVVVRNIEFTLLDTSLLL